MLTSIKSYFSLKFILITISLFLFTHNTLCQVKDEKEERINLSELSEELQLIVSKLPENCKRLRFYKEQDGFKLSYEIKFKFNKTIYSLEFTKNGLLEDIEITSKLKKIDKSIQSNIKKYFNESFISHKIIKLQKQYIYDSKKTTLSFIEDVLFQKTDTTSNFEIIVEVKSDKKRILKEITFNSNGTYLNSRELTPTSYEHVLY